MSQSVTAERALPPPWPSNRWPVAITLVAIALMGLAIWQAVDARQLLLFIIGGALGVTLYHASFGFTGGWRNFAVERRGAALRAQMLMIAVATLTFIPLLAADSVFGRPLGGAVAPVGVSVLIGAAVFGFGMQLGGGCGSGTLFTVGGGNTRMVVTLAFFILGALLGSAHLPWWLTLPSWNAAGLGDSLGVGGGIAVTLAGLALITALTVWIERRSHGSLERPSRRTEIGWRRLLTGPWPLVGAGLGLAGLSIITLLVAGHTWSITFAFGLWGAKIAQTLGIAVETWPFWTWPGPARALSNSVLDDTTSVMNFGIILGAALAAGLAGKFSPKASLPLGSALAAAIGGLLMGYGARLAFGCNIGAMFSGIASGSLHGWLWFGAAFAGSLLGIRLRPLFGLDGFKSQKVTAVP